MSRHLLRDQRGFTLVDVLAVILVLGILMAMTVPTMMASLDSLRLGQAAREVEREIHMARSRAVSKGRAIRMRFNCPVAGAYRITELIGTPSIPVAADTASNRCDTTAYPNTPPDMDPMTRPNLDGPVRYLPDDVTFAASDTIEFRSDGTAHYSGGSLATPWPLIPTTGVSVTLSRKGKTANITVNGLGKILLVP